MAGLASLLIKIFLISFFINLLYEVLHSLLYKTCIEAPLPKYVYVILKAALFDGLSITVIYAIFYSAFKTQNLFYSYLPIIAFILISLVFAYIWEYYAIKKKRWEYSDNMPLVLGVGITPLIQLASTGILSIFIAVNF